MIKQYSNKRKPFQLAEFLNTSDIRYFLEEVIKGGADGLILINPFHKLKDRMKTLLAVKDLLKVGIQPQIFFYDQLGSGHFVC